MLTIRKVNYSVDYDYLDNRICDCGRRICSVIEADNVKIGFCEDCLSDLLNQFNKLKKEIDKTCQYCKHFQKDKYDYALYGGKCLNRLINIKNSKGEEITVNPDTGHLDTCENFELKD